jgi:predicted tellurium resistance membrane protein TerC
LLVVCGNARESLVANHWADFISCICAMIISKQKKLQSMKMNTLNKKENWVYKHTIGRFGIFWSTVIMVEVMDLAFSIDNVLLQ